MIHVMVNSYGSAGYEDISDFPKAFPRAENLITKAGWGIKVKVPFELLGKTPKPGESWVSISAAENIQNPETL